MTKFLFKSAQKADLQKLANQHEVILNEQRHQRQDLAALLYLIKQLKNDLSLQKTVDDYYDSSVASPKVLVQDPPVED